MKKLLKVVAVAIFAVVPFLVGSSASAATCEIGFTGPNSNNQCVSVTQYSCSVTNTNTVTITNSNQQVVASGTVTNSGNGQTGSSTSGTVTNNNGTTFTVSINNTAPQASTCTATVIVPATETPVTPASVQPTQTTKAAALPKTSGDLTTVLIVIASSLATVAALGVGGVALYRHYKSL